MPNTLPHAAQSTTGFISGDGKSNRSGLAHGIKFNSGLLVVPPFECAWLSDLLPHHYTLAGTHGAGTTLVGCGGSGCVTFDAKAETVGVCE
jgi:hypothetical protein